ncbi:hypothetical protein EU538_05785, partial [Candidatus Thorarchaeota archaeon]
MRWHVTRGIVQQSVPNVDRQKGIDVLFNPRSVAVIGASETRGKLGNDVMRNLIESGFDGRIYPI